MSALGVPKQVFCLGWVVGGTWGHPRDTCCQKTSHSLLKSFSGRVWMELFCAMSSCSSYSLGLRGWALCSGVVCAWTASTVAPLCLNHSRTVQNIV